MYSFIYLEILDELPGRPNFRKQVTRKRLENLPPNPVRLCDLEEIPPQYRQTLDGSNFLIYDSYEDDDDEEEEEEDECGRILIFRNSG